MIPRKARLPRRLLSPISLTLPQREPTHEATGSDTPSTTSARPTMAETPERAVEVYLARAFITSGGSGVTAAILCRVPAEQGGSPAHWIRLEAGL